MHYATQRRVSNKTVTIHPSQTSEVSGLPRRRLSGHLRDSKLSWRHGLFFGGKPDASSGWIEENTNPTGYLCFTAMTFINVMLRVLACPVLFISFQASERAPSIWQCLWHSGLLHSAFVSSSLILFTARPETQTWNVVLCHPAWFML